MTDTIQPTILFKRPETIDGTVEFPLPDGTTAKLACTFKYRTKKEFGALWDEIAKTTIENAENDGADEAKSKVKTKPKKEEPSDAAKEEFSFEALFGRGDKAIAKNTMRYLASWPSHLPELGEASLMQVFNEAPASAAAFWDTYRSLCTRGMVGNS